MLKKDGFVPGRHAALLPAILLFACFLTGCGGPPHLSDYWRSKGTKVIKDYYGSPNASLYIRLITDHGGTGVTSGILKLLIDDKRVDNTCWDQYAPALSYSYSKWPLPLYLKTGTHNIMYQVQWSGAIWNPDMSSEFYDSTNTRMHDEGPKITPIDKFSVDLKENEVWLLIFQASYLKSGRWGCTKIGDRGKFTYHPDAKYHEDPQINKYLKQIFRLESTNTLK